MSEFFRMAAQCDSTIASTAPVKLYACPPVENDEGEESTSTAPVRPELSLTERIRSVLDAQHAQSTRKNLLRDANVLRIEALRDSKVQSRFKAVEERHHKLREESLLLNHQTGEGEFPPITRAAGLSPRSKARAEEEALVRRVREMELVKMKNDKESKLLKNTYGEEAATGAPHTSDTRDPFELLRMEERRRLQLYNTTNFDTSGDLRGVTSKSLKGKIPGGIIGMYNEVTLDHTFDKDGRPRVEAGVSTTAFPTDIQTSSGDAPTRQTLPASVESSSVRSNNNSSNKSLIIPKHVGSLVAEGYGQDKAAKMLLDLNRKRELLKDQQMTVLAEEGAERVQAKAQLKLQDTERQMMLTEFVVQDNERSRVAKQDAEAALVAKQRAQLNYSLTVKPEHPIDTYHRQIREDVFGDRKQLEADKVYQSKLKALTM